MATPEDAQKAIEGLNGALLDGRNRTSTKHPQGKSAAQVDIAEGLGTGTVLAGAVNIADADKRAILKERVGPKWSHAFFTADLRDGADVRHLLRPRLGCTDRLKWLPIKFALPGK